MPTLYHFEQRHNGTIITTEHGSVYSPIARFEDVPLHLEKFWASDRECERIIKELQRTGKSSAYLPDGKGLTAYGMLFEFRP